MGKPASTRVRAGRTLRRAIVAPRFWDRPGPPAALQRKMFFSLLLISGQAALFSRQFGGSQLLPLLLVPFAGVWGVLWHAVEKPERRLASWLQDRLGRLLAGFWLFFLQLVLSILLLSVVISCPAGWLIEHLWDSVDLAQSYMLYSMNLVFVFAPIRWAGWWLKAGAPP